MVHSSHFIVVNMDDIIDEGFDEIAMPVDGQLNIEVELEQFRQQWHDEIIQSSEHNHSSAVNLNVKSNGNVDSMSDEPSMEDQAGYLFVQGINAEKAGRLCDAIQYYRRSIQLVPDIERRMRDVLNNPKRRDNARTESESSVDPSDELGDDMVDLIDHINKVKIADNDMLTCQPDADIQMTHISALPVEVLTYIFKWVVSADLDVHSLEQISRVCRGFYLHARDEELWRLVCLRTWGKNCGRPQGFGSYRNMYIERPHLRFNGCYISKCTYFREGEKSLDNCYRPFHVVEYYRYIRFFPEGKVLMLTTPENPYVTLPLLRTRSSNIQGLLTGYYKLVGDRVTLVLKRKVSQTEYIQPMYRYRRQKVQNNGNNESDQTFEVELIVRGLGGRPHWQLTWSRYYMITKYRLTREEATIDFELTNNSYPSLLFSRVRSFTAVSDTPLH